MRKIIFAFTLAAAFAVAVSTVPASAQTQSAATASVTAKKHLHAKRRAAARRAQGGQIACTILGCRRIPANCTPVTEYDWDGAPTSFDAVVCR